MTIAIGAYFVGGLIVSADTNVVATDGIVTSGKKVSGVEYGHSSFVIANAGDDGNAGDMLAGEILNALSGDADIWKIEPTIKKVMKDWHSGYAQGNPPQLSFVLAASTGRQYRRLYFCEAPNTVLKKDLGQPVAIGAGARVVDPLLPSVIIGAVPVGTALLQVAYLMYRAKRDLVYIKGSETDTMVMSSDGSISVVPRQEMAEAEAIGEQVDDIFRQLYLGVFSQKPKVEQRRFVKDFSKIYIALAKEAEGIIFPSLAPGS